MRNTYENARAKLARGAPKSVRYSADARIKTRLQNIANLEKLRDAMAQELAAAPIKKRLSDAQLDELAKTL